MCGLNSPDDSARRSSPHLNSRKQTGISNTHSHEPANHAVYHGARQDAERAASVSHFLACGVGESLRNAEAPAPLPVCQPGWLMVVICCRVRWVETTAPPRGGQRAAEGTAACFGSVKDTLQAGRGQARELAGNRQPCSCRGRGQCHP